MTSEVRAQEVHTDVVPLSRTVSSSFDQLKQIPS